MISLKKLEQFLFYFFLFAIPFQARKILYYPSWPFNEWQAISLYGTDILLAILLIFWMVHELGHFKIKAGDQSYLIYEYFLLIFVLISAVSIINSSSQFLSVYNFIKLGEMVLFFFYLKNYAFRRFDIFGSTVALISGGLFQAVIAIGQFWRQKDFGLKLLGESTLNYGLVGIANFISATGTKIIRAYGTTPHPNILAGYLLISIFAFYAAYLGFKKKFRSLLHGFPMSLVYAIILFGLFFTFSRAVIFIFGVLLLAGFIFTYRYLKEYKKEAINIILMTAIFSLVFAVFYWPEISSRIKISGDDQAVAMRVFYNQESMKSHINIFGVGIGNFVNWFMDMDSGLPQWVYQPVHNIYLLIYSETGIFGISSFLLFLFFLLYDFFNKVAGRRYLYIAALPLIAILMISLVDHFPWTLQQGRLMFWLSAGLVAFYGNKA